MSSADENQGAPREPGHSGYAYSSPDLAYGSASVGESSAQRNFRDYLLILRERIWYIIVVFLVVVSVSVL